MTIKEFAEQFVLTLNITQCYIAIMPSDNDTFHLEVETLPSDTIGAEYDTETQSLEGAREQANELARVLAERGIFVYDNRLDWEAKGIVEEE